MDQEQVQLPGQQGQQSNRNNGKSLESLINTKYVFGYRGDFKDNIFVIDDQNKILYPAGHNIVTVSYESKETKQTMRIREGLRQTQRITCMQVSRDKKYLAYALESDPAIIVVQDLTNKKKKIKYLMTRECKSREYVSLIFRVEQEKKIKKAPYLLSLSGQPDYQLIMWNWEKATPKIIAMYKVLGAPQSLYSVFSHPKEEDLYCIVGNNYFKTFKFVNNGFQLQVKSPFSKNENKDTLAFNSTNYISNCLLNQDEILIVGTDQGDLLVINQALDYKAPPLKDGPGEGYAVECIVPTAKGFIIGGTGATLHIYEKSENEKKNYVFQKERTLQYKESVSRILSHCLDDDNIIFGLENGSLMKTQFITEKQDEIKFDHVIQPFHTEKITGLDICTRKTLVATCSVDRTVRVWNYLDMSLEVMKEFDEPAMSISFHPSGYHLVVAFKSKVRMINILMNDLVSYKTIPTKDANVVKFSNGGKFFALANKSRVLIYETFKGYYDKVLNSQNKKSEFNNVFWYPNDKKVLTGSQNGEIIEYALHHEGEAQAEQVNILQVKGSKINSILATSLKNTESVYCSVNDNHIYQIEHKDIKRSKSDYKRSQLSAAIGEIGEKQAFSKIFTGSNIEQIILTNNEKHLFMGVREQEKPGCLRVSHFPLTKQVHEIQPHHKGIAKMCVDYEDKWFFTAGDDGALIVYSIKEGDHLMQEKDESKGVYAEDQLISRQEYMGKLEKYRQLEDQINTLKITNQLNLERKQENLRKQQEMYEAKKAKCEKEEREKIEELAKQKREMIRNFEIQKEIKRKEFIKKRDKIEDHFRKQILQEKERTEEIKADIEKANQEFEEFCSTFKAQKKEENQTYYFQQ